jgi:predicted O-methyltransferase YrrM
LGERACEAMLPLIARAALDILPIYYPGNPYLGSGETAVVVSLVYSVRPRVMIEFGCNTGRTAKAVLDNVSSLQRYIGIDVPPSHQPTLECQVREVPMRAGFCPDDRRFWLLVRNRGSLGLTPSDMEPCDAAFIDGDHSAAAVRHDSELARSLTRAGGIIVWHDYGNPAVEVTAVLDRLHQDERWPIHHVENTWLAFLRVN